MNYEALLEEVMALLAADCGFVVLGDPPDQYAATHNFDTALFLQPPGEELTEHQHMREILPAILAASEPILTDNALRDSYYYRKIRIVDWKLRHVIAIPLKKEGVVYGLLWCDKSIRAKGLWTQQDLEQAAALVERFHESNPK
jgi:transcriptional regulator with GAF, ATPase, and Fis domain